MDDHIEKYCATKVELMAFREESAVNFGKIHVEIAKLYTENEKTRTKIAEAEVRIIKWFVGTAIAIAASVFAIARYWS